MCIALGAAVRDTPFSRFLAVHLQDKNTLLSVCSCLNEVTALKSFSSPVPEN